MTAFDSQYDLVNEDDAALLRRFVGTRDEDAFAAIVQRYTSPVYATCRRVLGSRSLAEEASQEAFLRLLKQPEKIRQSLGGWLHRTATTISIDMIRKDASRRTREQSFAAAPREVSRWDELSLIIDEALADLPDDDCDLLVQHFIRGRSQRELADELKISPATMSRRMHAALDALREKLRARGVAVAIAALTFMLGTSAAEAAPLALTIELGKMSMISGSKALATSLVGAGTSGGSGAGTSGGSGAATTLAAMLPIALGTIVVLAAAGVIAIAVLFRTQPAAPPVRVMPTDDVAAAPVPTPQPADQTINIYVLPTTLDNVSATHISMFEDPAAAKDNMVTVVYADSHVARISVPALVEQLRKQTGQTLEILTSNMQPQRRSIDKLAPATRATSKARN